MTEQVPYELRVAREKGFTVSADMEARYVCARARVLTDDQHCHPDCRHTIVSGDQDMFERSRYLAQYPRHTLQDELSALESVPGDVRAALDDPFPVTQEMISQYQQDGYIQIKGVLPPSLVQLLGDAIRAHTMERNPRKGTPLDERSTYNKAFIQVGSPHRFLPSRCSPLTSGCSELLYAAQVGGLWRHGGLAQLFSFSRRLAGIAADLMQAEGTLLHHDQALFKEAGGGHTPWHCDQQYWPLDAESECPATSCWVPLVDCPLEMGPLQVCAAATARSAAAATAADPSRCMCCALLYVVCQGVAPR